MAKAKQAFICSQCGYESPKWYGQCPKCKEWGSMEECILQPSVSGNTSRAAAMQIKPISEIVGGSETRFSTGLKELDRVLGGGLVHGSLTLVGGDPGIGKSTLMLQICQSLGRERSVLYVSGEESMSQIKLRAERLGVDTPNLFLACETNVESIVAECTATTPGVLIVDSVQTMMCERASGTPGSVSQIKEATAAFMHLAKEQGITVFVIGHVTKEGSLVSFPKKGSQEDPLVEAIKQYLAQHITDTVRIENICDEFDYSRSYLNKRFRMETGSSLASYITSAKIEEAKRLIRESDLNFAQISEYLSFDNPQYFSRVFHKVTGMTPTEFKNLAHI